MVPLGGGVRGLPVRAGSLPDALTPRDSLGLKLLTDLEGWSTLQLILCFPESVLTPVKMRVEGKIRKKQETK